LSFFLLGESRDSGVSENHSRQSSDPSSATLGHLNGLKLNDSNIIELLVNEERRRSNEAHVDDDFWNQHTHENKLDEETRIQCLEDQIREQEVSSPISIIFFLLFTKN
jgi:hypothetical protein